ncbi:MAG: hypothetical protein PWQ85_377 [Geotoga sp.]|nr:hypothetical protein [Geotoga sp.]
MKKILLFLVLIMIIFIFSGCSMFSQQEEPKLPDQDIQELQESINQLNEKLTKMEKDINQLSDEFYQNKRKESYDYSVITDLKTQFSSMKERLTLIEGLIYKGESSDKVEKILNLNKRVENIEKSITSIETGGTSSSSTVIGEKVGNIEEEINMLKSEISDIKNNQEDIYILNKISEINERLDSIEKQKSSSNIEFNEDEIRALIDKTIKNMDLSTYLEDTIEYKAEQAISKLYYGSQSESLIKINELSENVLKLEEQIQNLEYQFQTLSSKPSNSLQERYLSEITDLEKKINAALFSIGDSQLRSLYENQEEIVYTVKSGDYLGKISNAFSLGPNGVDIIMAANNIEDPKYIRVGQKLTIPVGNIENYIEWPLKSTKSSEYNRIVIKFGQRTENGISSGIGVLPAKNEQVYPLLPGRVIETGTAMNGNWYVKIDHGNSIVSMISNIRTIYVKEGDWVNNESSLGLVEKDKIVSLELWKSGEPKDPLKLFFKISGDFMATYYTEWDDKYVHYPTFRITKSGKIPTVWKTIAADPEVLPIGTVVYIPELKELPNGGFFVVEDTGGKVIGKKIDIYVNDVRLAQKTEDVTIYIVGKEG